MKLLIIGQNPARGMENETPFHNTKSGERLFRWLKDSGVSLDDCTFINVWYKLGKLPGSLLMRQYSSLNLKKHNCDRIITVGKVAQKIIAPLTKLPILNIPHPSGLNRKLNDPKIEQQIIQNLKEFVK